MEKAEADSREEGIEEEVERGPIEEAATEEEETVMTTALMACAETFSDLDNAGSVIDASSGMRWGEEVEVEEATEAEDMEDPLSLRTSSLPR